MMETSSRSGLKFSGRQKSIVTTIVVVALIVGYVLLQPVIERKLGIQLPNLLDEEPAAKQQLPDEHAAADRQANQADQSTATKQRPAAKTAAPDGDERPGVLRDIGRNIKVSPAGLRYGLGSFEGNRVQHILRHAEDDPSRPIHGVFDGGEDEIFAVIDEAYLIAKQGGPRVEVEREGARTIYTVDLRRRIGYIGGQSGRRSNHPPATGVRLVLENVDVITAFPVRP
jgi:hypothetical protein